MKLVLGGRRERGMDVIAIYLSNPVNFRDVAPLSA